MRTKQTFMYGFLAVVLAFTACEQPTDSAHVHQWGEYAVTIAATCSAKGVETRTCALDITHKETRDIEIDPTAHDWKVGDYMELKPTCTKDGIGTRVCVLCKKIEAYGVIPALGHDWEDWDEADVIITLAPTCTTVGNGNRACLRNGCDGEDSAEGNVPALGHDYQDWTETTAPTCSEVGKEEASCTRDSSHVKDIRDIPIDPTAHNYQNYVQTTVPTCSAKGIDTGTCTYNNLHKNIREGADIDPDNHNYNYVQTTAPTCSERGIDTGTCPYNNSHTTVTRIGADINPNAHNYNYVQTTAPTCSARGIDTGTCTYNNSHATVTREGAAIDPTAHDYQWVTIAPSYIEAGADKEICSRCADENGNTRNPVPALLITTTQQWTTALNQLNRKTGSYTLTINGNIAVTGTGTSTITFGNTALTVTLKGSGRLSLSSNGSIIRVGANQTLIIDSANLILEGKGSNSTSLVYVSDSTAKLELRNGTISGNTVVSNASPSSSYSAYCYGGGVYVGNGTFTMSGGTISGNYLQSLTLNQRPSYSYGGGVYVSSGTFIMNGGTISNNTADPAAVTTAYSYGGGVYVGSGTFTMNGGTISNNTASSPSTNYYCYGGGVYVDNGTFIKTDGTIIGNLAYNLTGGHAVYVYNANSSKWRNTTAGPGVNLDSTKDGTAGGWEN